MFGIQTPEITENLRKFFRLRGALQFALGNHVVPVVNAGDITEPPYIGRRRRWLVWNGLLAANTATRLGWFLYNINPDDTFTLNKTAAHVVESMQIVMPPTVIGDVDIIVSYAAVTFGGGITSGVTSSSLGIDRDQAVGDIGQLDGLASNRVPVRVRGHGNITAVAGSVVATHWRDQYDMAPAGIQDQRVIDVPGFPIVLRGSTAMFIDVQYTQVIAELINGAIQITGFYDPTAEPNVSG